jgi:hypothetical protein
VPLADGGHDHLHTDARAAQDGRRLAGGAAPKVI